jgi:hypothetical protein
MALKYEAIKKGEFDEIYTYEHKYDNDDNEWVEEITDLFVIDDQDLTCNLCGEVVGLSACIHFLKESSSDDWDTVEEEIILCPDCVKKMAQLFEPQ